MMGHLLFVDPYGSINGRYRYAYKKRLEGLTYEKIGVLLGVCKERTRILVLKGELLNKKYPSVYNNKDVYKEFVEHCNEPR